MRDDEVVHAICMDKLRLKITVALNRNHALTVKDLEALKPIVERASRRACPTRSKSIPSRSRGSAKQPPTRPTNGGSMSRPLVPVAILVRVSTFKQETQRQISELQAYAERQRYEVLEVCRETVSGRADDADRPALRRVETLAREGKIKKVLVHEISRLARRNSVAHRFVETLETCGVSLYWHAQGIETLMENGMRNPAAGIMLACSRRWRATRLRLCGPESIRALPKLAERREAWQTEGLNSNARDISSETQRRVAPSQSRTVGAQHGKDCRQKRLYGPTGCEGT